MGSPMEGLVFHNNNNNLNTLCVTPSSLTYKRGLKRAAEDAEEQRPSPDIQPAETQEAAPPRVITGMFATIPQSLWYFGATLVNGLVDLISSRHAPPAQQQAAQQHAATSQPIQITGVATDHSDRKRRAVDTSPTNASRSNTSPAHTSPTARVRNRHPMHLNITRRVHGTSAVSPAASHAESDRHIAFKATEVANRLAWYKQYYDPSLANLAKQLKLAKVQESTTTTQPAAIDKSIPIKDRQIGGLIQKAIKAQGTTTAQRAIQKRKAAQAKAAARKEAARAAEVALHLELDKKEAEEARIAAEEEKQRIAAEEEKSRTADEEDKQRIAAEQEAQRVAAEQEAQRVAAEEEEKRVEADQEAQRAVAEADEDLERAKWNKEQQITTAEEPNSVYSQTVVNLGERLWMSIDDLLESTKQDRETVIQLGSIPLQMITFKRILNTDGAGTESWLDDDAVNAWFNLIVEEKKLQTAYVKSDTKPPPFANLQSAWYAKYNTKEKAKGLKRWMKRAGVGGTNILKCERIFLPINAGSHWTLLIINGVERSIEYLNSLGGNGQRYFEIARDILKSELGDKYLDKEWTDLKRNRSYQQSNMDDCGVFTCMNGLAAAKGRPYSDVQARFMGSARTMMAGVFLNGEMGFAEVIEL